MGEISGATDLSMQGSTILEQITSDLQSGSLSLDKALEDIGTFA